MIQSVDFVDTLFLSAIPRTPEIEGFIEMLQ